MRQYPFNLCLSNWGGAGERVVSINGQSITSMSHEQVVSTIMGCKDGLELGVDASAGSAYTYQSSPSSSPTRNKKKVGQNGSIV